MRVGIGYDAHRLVAGRALVLGGVEIAAEQGLEGHSDADVLVHAIIDALLGAAALGTIGEHFPDSDPNYADISSLELLSMTAALVEDHGRSIINVDSQQAAIALLGDHPHLHTPGATIELHEFIAMPGM